MWELRKGVRTESKQNFKHVCSMPCSKLMVAILHVGRFFILVIVIHGNVVLSFGTSIPTATPKPHGCGSMSQPGPYTNLPSVIVLLSGLIDVLWCRAGSFWSISAPPIT
jgi:hypothetical protein